MSEEKRDEEEEEIKVHEFPVPAPATLDAEQRELRERLQHHIDEAETPEDFEQKLRGTIWWGLDKAALNTIFTQQPARRKNIIDALDIGESQTAQRLEFDRASDELKLTNQEIKRLQKPPRHRRSKEEEEANAKELETLLDSQAQLINTINKLQLNNSFISAEFNPLRYKQFEKREERTETAWHKEKDLQKKMVLKRDWILAKIAKLQYRVTHIEKNLDPSASPIKSANFRVQLAKEREQLKKVDRNIDREIFKQMKQESEEKKDEPLTEDKEIDEIIESERNELAQIEVQRQELNRRGRARRVESLLREWQIRNSLLEHAIRKETHRQPKLRLKRLQKIMVAEMKNSVGTKAARKITENKPVYPSDMPRNEDDEVITMKTPSREIRKQTGSLVTPEKVVAATPSLKRLMPTHLQRLKKLGITPIEPPSEVPRRRAPLPLVKEEDVPLLRTPFKRKRRGRKSIIIPKPAIPEEDEEKAFELVETIGAPEVETPADVRRLIEKEQAKQRDANKREKERQAAEKKRQDAEKKRLEEEAEELLKTPPRKGRRTGLTLTDPRDRRASIIFDSGKVRETPERALEGKMDKEFEKILKRGKKKETTPPPSSAEFKRQREEALAKEFADKHERERRRIEAEAAEQLRLQNIESEPGFASLPESIQNIIKGKKVDPGKESPEKFRESLALIRSADQIQKEIDTARVITHNVMDDVDWKEIEDNRKRVKERLSFLENHVRRASNSRIQKEKQENPNLFVTPSKTLSARDVENQVNSTQARLFQNQNRIFDMESQLEEVNKSFHASEDPETRKALKSRMQKLQSLIEIENELLDEEIEKSVNKSTKPFLKKNIQDLIRVNKNIPKDKLTPVILEGLEKMAQSVENAPAGEILEFGSRSPSPVQAADTSRKSGQPSPEPEAQAQPSVPVQRPLPVQLPRRDGDDEKKRPPEEGEEPEVEQQIAPLMRFEEAMSPNSRNEYVNLDHRIRNISAESLEHDDDTTRAGFATFIQQLLGRQTRLELQAIEQWAGDEGVSIDHPDVAPKVDVVKKKLATNKEHYVKNRFLYETKLHPDDINAIVEGTYNEEDARTQYDRLQNFERQFDEVIEESSRRFTLDAIKSEVLPDLRRQLEEQFEPERPLIIQEIGGPVGQLDEQDVVDIGARAPDARVPRRLEEVTPPPEVEPNLGEEGFRDFINAKIERLRRLRDPDSPRTRKEKLEKKDERVERLREAEEKFETLGQPRRLGDPRTLPDVSDVEERKEKDLLTRNKQRDERHIDTAKRKLYRVWRAIANSLWSEKMFDAIGFSDFSPFKAIDSLRHQMDRIKRRSERRWGRVIPEIDTFEKMTEILRTEKARIEGMPKDQRKNEKILSTGETDDIFRQLQGDKKLQKLHDTARFLALSNPEKAIIDKIEANRNITQNDINTFSNLLERLPADRYIPKLRNLLHRARQESEEFIMWGSRQRTKWRQLAGIYADKIRQAEEIIAMRRPTGDLSWDEFSQEVTKNKHQKLITVGEQRQRLDPEARGELIRIIDQWEAKGADDDLNKDATNLARDLGIPDTWIRANERNMAKQLSELLDTNPTIRRNLVKQAVPTRAELMRRNREELQQNAEFRQFMQEQYPEIRDILERGELGDIPQPKGEFVIPTKQNIEALRKMRGRFYEIKGKRFVEVPASQLQPGKKYLYFE